MLSDAFWGEPPKTHCFPVAKKRLTLPPVSAKLWLMWGSLYEEAR